MTSYCLPHVLLSPMIVEVDSTMCTRECLVESMHVLQCQRVAQASCPAHLSAFPSSRHHHPTAPPQTDVFVAELG
jgi:hypothetical protein